MRKTLATLAAPVLFALAGCSGLPGSAPTASHLEEQPQSAASDILLFNADPDILGVLSKLREGDISSAIRRDSYRPTTALHPGDVISINIFETGGPTLFGAPVGGSMPSVGSTSANNMSAAPHEATMPPQVIEANGRVMVPFVGPVSVAGLTPMQAGKRIQALLGRKTLEPQVIVSLIVGDSLLANVSGDVGKPGPVPLTLRGERLLDVIAAAGGSKDNEFDTDIRVIRGRANAAVSMTALVADPAANNILVHPGDQIVVEKNPKTFTVMGAAPRTMQYALDQPVVTLAEALARAGGSLETVGDISGIYVFRVEPAAVVRKLLSVAASALDPNSPAKATPESIVGSRPVMFRFNLTKADGYFNAQRMAIHNKDVILITDAQGTELLKLFTLIRGGTGIVYDLSNQVYRTSVRP